MSFLVLRDVEKSFENVRVIKGLSLSIERGEFCVLVGPSGCGKSTALRSIAGLEEIDSGAIHVAGRDVTGVAPAKRGVAMVFQNYALYPHLTVRDNIGFGLSLGRRPKAEIKEKVDAAASMLRITPLLDRKPGQLSGGQRQRVAIGRAITRNPDVFLFDEPLSNLDAALRTQMRMELLDLHRRLGSTMVYVTHDQVEAMTMADQMVILNKGRVEQSGKPIDLYRKPASTFVAAFLGAPPMNLLPASAAGESGYETFGIRPEHLRIADAGGRWKGEVAYVEHLGAETIVHVNVEGLKVLQVRQSHLDGISVGESLWLQPDPDQVHRFAADGAAL